MKITKELLIKNGACDEGISWFEEHYPNGVTITAKAISECKNCPTEFIWWFYNNVSKDDRLLTLCGVNRSNGVDSSYGVNRSESVNNSGGVNYSNGVNWSKGVNSSNGVNWSHGVNHSNGVNGSDGVNRSFGVYGSFGVDCALFLANKPRTYTIFGKEVSEKRFNNVYDNLIDTLHDWHPTFNNIKSLYLENGSNWVKTPINDAKEISKREAWADMPKEAIDYIKSLPEFDADMFAEITGIEV